MVQYIYGGNTGETPESLKRRREAIEALIMGQQTPKNWGEGWGAVMKGVAAGIEKGRIGKAERAGRQSGDSVFNKIFSGITGGASPEQLGGQSAAGNLPMSGAGGEVAATTPGATPDMTGNEVYSGFMDTVKRGGVNNPFALAAIAATGDAESGFSPGNVNRTWSDPSESGQAGTAGGIMSWRGPRYQALAASGDLSPEGQANFFLQENPQLIAQLQNAKSVEEAQSLMNNAWKFAGYDRPGGEAANRLASARSYLPSFQNGGDVAAASPQQVFNAVMPELAKGEVPLSAEVAEFRQTPEFMQAYPSGFNQQPLSDQRFDERWGGPASLPVSGYSSSGQPTTGQNPQQLADATGGMMPAENGGQQSTTQQFGQQQTQNMSGLSLQQLYQAAANPWLSQEQRSVVNLLLEQELQKQQSARGEQAWRGRQEYEQQLRQSDPSYQLERDLRRAQIEKMNREASTDGETFFGNPVAVQNDDGSISYGQIGNKGTFRPIQLGEGQKFAPPTKTIDTPTESILMDQAGNVISRTPKKHREAEREKAIGSGEGKIQADTQAEYDSITSKMPGLYGVIDRLETLAEDATYTMAGKSYDWARNQLGLDPREGAVARAEYTAVVDNQILPLLRDTFGAQFTQEEGQRLARTLGDPDKSPVEKQALLRAFIQQKERDIQGLAARLGMPGGSQAGADKGKRQPVSIGGYTIEEVD